MKNLRFEFMFGQLLGGVLIGAITSSLVWAFMTTANSTSRKIIAEAKELRQIDPMSPMAELAKRGFKDEGYGPAGVSVMFGKEIRYGPGLAITPVIIRPKTGNRGYLLFNIDPIWAGL